MTEALLTPQDVAEYFAVPLSTIYKWNSEGTGPKYLKVGRHARYRRADILEFENAQYVDQPVAASRPA
ncbi:MAG: helix-turn-helix transcriptional regulator [Gammaproteobacteria bacterium]